MAERWYHFIDKLGAVKACLAIDRKQVGKFIIHVRTQHRCDFTNFQIKLFDVFLCSLPLCHSGTGMGQPHGKRQRPAREDNKMHFYGSFLWNPRKKALMEHLLVFFWHFVFLPALLFCLFSLSQNVYFVRRLYKLKLSFFCWTRKIQFNFRSAIWSSIKRGFELKSLDVAWEHRLTAHTNA